MSGICGICQPGRELDSADLAFMLDGVSVANEQARSAHAARSIALGGLQRRSFQQVAVVDRVSAVANADLIDLVEAGQALSLAPDAAAVMPTAELVARLYLRRGPQFLTLLHGAFSIALWDDREQQLLLAIDRLGIHSLYWRQERDRLLFASRANAIRAVQSSPPEVNPAAILQFLLFSAVPAPLASDYGTQKLEPGTALLFNAGKIKVQSYWDVEYPESSNQKVSYWSQELRESMRAAVRRHLEGCDPVSTGCFLSGGTDSSSVVAFASEGHRPVKSFSIAFSEAAFSEIEFARTTAAAFQTQHKEKFLSPADACEAIDKIIGYFDEPFANSSAIGSYYCAVLARENGVDTLLAGDGGDELFGGNERYATDKRFALYHRLPGLLRSGVIEPLSNLLPADNGALSLPRRYVRRANIPNPRRILSYGFFLSLPPEEIFSDGFLEQVGKADWLAIPEGHYSRPKAAGELNRLLYLDLKMTLADNDLRKVCGTAELAGVRVRYPLLDDRLVELSGRIPESLKLRGFEKRYIFKQAMKEILPKKVLYKKKHGFGVPLAQWLLQDRSMKELLQDMLHDPRTRQRGYFRPGFYERLLGLHQEQPNFYGEIVWYLVALEMWHRRHLERSREVIHAV